MRIIKNLIIILIFSLSNNALAEAAANNYGSGYYEDEGGLLFKVRGFYSLTKGKMKNFPSVKNAGAKAPTSLISNGYGIDTSTTFFFTNNLATELSLGLSFYQTSKSALNETFAAFGTKSNALGKNNNIYMLPLTATAQFHIAPFGAIRPYIGGGYHGTFMYTQSKALKVSHSHGPVLQAGVDFISKDDTLFTLDIKQYFSQSKVTFKEGFLNTNDGINSKTTWNPIVISVGFGFRF